MKPTSEQIEKAVQFWAERLGRPTFKILDDEEARDPKNRDAKDALEVMEVTHARKFSDEQITAFKDSLRSTLGKMDIGRQIFIDVDYHPCEELQIALSAAGMLRGHWPIPLPLKTRMWLFPDGSVLTR